jgi:RNA recognition motif-containing protein
MTQLYVGNLSYDVSEADLRYAFGNFGRVSSVRMAVDQSTHRSRGFAFVMMPSMEDAEEAIKHMSGVSLKGRQITVNEAQDRERSSSGANAVNHKARDKAMAMFEALQND